MATLRALSVKLAMNATQFKREVGKVDRKFNKFSKNTQQRNKQMARSMVKLGVAVTAVTAGLSRFIKKAIDTGDRTSKFSKQVGVSIQALQALGLAGELAGVSMNEVETGFRRLSRSMSDANEGLSTQVRAFNDLGVSVANADGSLRTVDEVYRDVADKFSVMEDGALKSARAQEIFGRAGSQLIPMLNEGAAGMDKWAGKAAELGLVLTDTQADTFVAFNDSLTIISKQFEGMANRLAVGVTPALIKFSDTFSNLITNGRGGFVRFSGLLNKGLTFLTKHLDLIVGTLLPAAITLFGLWAIQLAATTAWTGLMAVVTLPALIVQFTALKAIQIVALFKTLAAWVAASGLAMLKIVAIGLSIVSALYAVSVAVRAVMDSAKNMGVKWAALWSALGDIASGVGGLIVASFKKAFHVALRGFKSFINNAIDLYNKMADTIGATPISPLDLSGNDATIKRLGVDITTAIDLIKQGSSTVSDTTAQLGSALWNNMTNIIMNDLEFIKGLPAAAQEAMASGLASLGTKLGITTTPTATGEGEGDGMGAGDGAGKTPGLWAEFTDASVVEKFSGIAEGVKSVWSDVTASMAKSGKAVFDSINGWEDVLESFKGESKKLMMLNKAMAIKEVIINGAAAASKALRKGFPAALPDLALIAAKTALSIKTIKGQAHDGIDNVPSTGTYLLEQGERVVDSRLNADLKEFMSNPAQAQTSQPATVNLHVNGVSDPDVVVEALASRRGELESMMRRITLDSAGQAAF